MSTRQTFDTIDLLRLEVEIPPEGLPNLVQNPSGDLGAWFWNTPVANTVMSAANNTLTFTTTAAQAANFTTDLMPVAATKYVSARVDLTAITTGHNIKMRYEWYDAAGALLSTSVQSPALSALGPVFGPTVQAPTNTTHVKLRVDFHNGTGNPSANAAVSFNRGMVTWQDTGTVTTVRTNLITNPSFEVNATDHWEATEGTLTRTTAVFYQGSASGNVAVAAGQAIIQTKAAARMAVTAGKAYTFQFKVKLASLSNDPILFAWVHWYNAAGSLIASSRTSTLLDQIFSLDWLSRSITATAPSGAVKAGIAIHLSGNSGYVDALQLEQANGVLSYFDGSFTDTATLDYAWTGVAHNSTSNATTIGGTFDYAEPVTWQNILGPTHELSIVREDLNAGTLTATVLDAALDPALGNTLRPGRKARVMAQDTSGVWSPLFTGKTTVLQVSYDLKDDTVPASKRARIVLEAVDAVQTLADTHRPSGVAALASLPWVLEGAGVPWNVNGSGNHVATATVVSNNEAATALDQVSITRDSTHGYAWVDRQGVLQAWTPANMPTTPVVIDEATYSGLDLGFSAAACINEVLVTGLTYAASTGTTTEVPYGPYRDTASITEWGTRSARFTVHGLTPAQIATFANEVLTANATPQMVASEVLIPIRDPADIGPGKAFLDLYTLVEVKNTEKGYDANQRITRVAHQITPDKWLVGLGFAAPSAVASPQVTPPVQNPDVVTEKAGAAATGTFSAVNTPKAVAVSFGATFPVAPSVMLTVVTTDPVQIGYPPGVTNVTTTGFTLNVARAIGTGSYSVAWRARVT